MIRQNRRLPPPRPKPPPEPTLSPTRVELLRQRLKQFQSRFRTAFLIGLCVVFSLAAMLLYNTTQPPPQRLTQRDINDAVERALASAKPKPSYESKAYEIIRPSLVRINVLIDKGEGKTEGALGTGVVIDDTGTILTSLHIIKNAAEVRVIFADGSESEASIILQQPETDLALLRPRIIPDDLVAATLTDSGTLRVGDEVVAVGNPYGINNSLSSGVVSGLKRSFKSQKTGAVLTNLIQFDAAVNPGNSGGPLLNRDGEVVGIVAALLNPNEQDVFIGIGFAVPIETAGNMGGSPPY
jgi:S1-C subfamily serine protease